MSEDRPALGAHRPFVPARSPGGKPTIEPKWRVVVHHKFLKRWEELVGRVGLTGAQQLWDYLTTQPGEPGPYRCVSKMRGTGKGKPTVWHYEVSGAGRVDFRVELHHEAKSGMGAHPTVFIIGINFGSH